MPKGRKSWHPSMRTSHRKYYLKNRAKHLAQVREYYYEHRQEELEKHKRRHKEKKMRILENLRLTCNDPQSLFTRRGMR